MVVEYRCGKEMLGFEAVRQGANQIGAGLLCCGMAGGSANCAAVLNLAIGKREKVTEL